MKQFAFIIGVSMFAGSVFGYADPFTLTFTNPGETTGWTDVNAEGQIVTGETTPPAGSPFTPTPVDGGWLRTSTAVTGQANGVATLHYNGTAGNSTTNPTNYSIEVDMYVMVHPTVRIQNGLIVRWTNTYGNIPFQFFHKVGLGTNGYGFRNGGSTATDDIFPPAETTDKWVRIKVSVDGNQATVSLDRQRDGVYELSHGGITLTGAAATSGRAGVQTVMNDQGLAISYDHGYFDNFKYTPIVPLNAVSDEWALYE